MKLSQFKFKLPEEQIALEPPYHRDECKLMVLHRKSQRIETGLDFRNILDYFDEDDAFIFNDTKVFPARLYGTKEKTDTKIEVFLLRELNADQRLWDVLVEPARKIRIVHTMILNRCCLGWERHHCHDILLTVALQQKRIWIISRPSMQRTKVL